MFFLHRIFSVFYAVFQMNYLGSNQIHLLFYILSNTPQVIKKRCKVTKWFLCSYPPSLILVATVTVATVATAVTGTAARAHLATTTAPPRDETRGPTPPRQAVVVVRRRRPVHQGTRCTWESTSCSRRLGKETLPKSNSPDTYLQDKRLAQLCIQFVHHG